MLKNLWCAMCTSRMRTKWILVNIQNNCRNRTDYVNRQVESSMLSDHRQRRPDDQKFDDDVAQKEGDGWLSEDAVNCQCLRMICQYSFKYWGALSCIHRRAVIQSLKLHSLQNIKPVKVRYPISWLQGSHNQMKTAAAWYNKSCCVCAALCL